MSSSPLFTQKHYEHVGQEISKMTDRDKARDVTLFMCHVFEMDNPKFQPCKFLRSARQTRQGDSKCKITTCIS